MAVMTILVYDRGVNCDMCLIEACMPAKKFDKMHKG